MAEPTTWHSGPRRDAPRPGSEVQRLCADQRERWRRGDRVPAEAYLESFPAVRDDPKAALDLVYHEFALRESLGERPDLAEFERRFPTYARRLRLQVERYRTLGPTDPQPAVSNEVSREGPAVPGYELMGELGRGGMGVVYKARQLSLNRLVALKMIRDGGHASPEQRTRFRAEAEAAARLQHPHIVQIYEVGEVAGQPYLAMEYAAGGSLAEQLQGRPLPVREAAQLVRTLAGAVQAAHEAGIVHRDLKPSNILLQEEVSRNDAKEDRKERQEDNSRVGNNEPSLRSSRPPLASLCETLLTPKITDFGLAKRLDGGPHGPTQTGEILGTPDYMAPEQASGRLREIGPATDVYALGAILYHLITGRPPFRTDSTLDTLLLVRSEEPMSPARLQRRCPRDLETVCLKCLHKDPARRYASARELADDLGRFLANEPVRARATPWWEHAARWVRRYPTIAALAALSAAITVLGFVLVLWQWREAEAARALATARAGDEARQRQRAEEALRQSEHNLYKHLLASAESAWLTGDASRADQLLEQCPTELRRWEWDYLRRRFEGSRLTLAGHQGTVSGVRFSPDGSRLASAGADGIVRIWDFSTRRELLRLGGHGAGFNAVAWSPDGTRLAGCTGPVDTARKALPGEVLVWDARTGDEQLCLSGHLRWVANVAWSPDGTRLASAGRDPDHDKEPSDVKVWDAADGKELRTLHGHGGSVLGVAFSPDGRRLASCGFDRVVRIWDAESGKPLFVCTGHGDVVPSIAFSPDGKTLATASFDRKVCAWNADTGKLRLTCTGHTANVLDVAFSPDGKRLASAGWDRTVRVWDAATGQAVAVLKGHTGWVHSVAFGPDGRIASGAADRLVKVWDVADAQDEVVLRGHKDWVPGLAFSPDGRLLASAGGDKLVKLWDVATLKEVRSFEAHHGDVKGVAFSPDGARLATCSDDGAMRLWNAATAELLREFVGHEGDLHGVAFSPDGRRLLSSGQDGTVRLWDAEKGAPLLTLRGQTGPVLRAVFSSDGGLIASGGGDGTVRLWDAATGAELRVLRGHGSPVRAVAFSPDGRRLASVASDRDRADAPNELKVWDVATGQAVVEVRDPGPVFWKVTFHPGGERLVTTSDEGGVKLWDVALGQEVFSLKGHDDDVRAAVFSPDGHVLATAGDDQTIRIWDGTPGR
jgi:eukaryotic-like serine/threonine-protein kinase